MGGYWSSLQEPPTEVPKEESIVDQMPQKNKHISRDDDFKNNEFFLNEEGGHFVTHTNT